MNAIGPNLLYTDTDSVIFAAGAGDYIPECGTFLGDLTNEITDKYGVRAYGVAFASPAPKSYSLQINADGEDETNNFAYINRCKGFTINADSKNILNYEGFCNLVTKNSTTTYSVPTKMFSAGKYGGVTRISTTKKLQFTYTKRRITNDITFETEPWGYIRKKRRTMRK